MPLWNAMTHFFSFPISLNVQSGDPIPLSVCKYTWITNTRIPKTMFEMHYSDKKIWEEIIYSSFSIFKKRNDFKIEKRNILHFNTMWIFFFFFETHYCFNEETGNWQFSHFWKWKKYKNQNLPKLLRPFEPIRFGF